MSVAAPHQSIFYRLDALPVTQPTVSEHWRQVWKRTFGDNHCRFLQAIWRSLQPTIGVWVLKGTCSSNASQGEPLTDLSLTCCTDSWWKDVELPLHWLCDASSFLACCTNSWYKETLNSLYTGCMMPLSELTVTKVYRNLTFCTEISRYKKKHVKELLAAINRSKLAPLENHKNINQQLSVRTYVCVHSTLHSCVILGKRFI